jgi:hypothetical protein
MQRDPIPWDKPRLFVLLQSQFILLSSLVKSIDTDPKATLGDYTHLSVIELRSLALNNARKILDLLVSRPFTGSF